MEIQLEMLLELMLVLLFKLLLEVQLEMLSHGCPSDGRYSNVASDNGRWHSGDTGLREDRVVASSSQIDDCVGSAI